MPLQQRIKDCAAGRDLMHRLADLVEMRNPFPQQIAAAAVPPSSEPAAHSACAYSENTITPLSGCAERRYLRMRMPSSVDVGDIRTSVNQCRRLMPVGEFDSGVVIHCDPTMLTLWSVERGRKALFRDSKQSSATGLKPSS